MPEEDEFLRAHYLHNGAMWCANELKRPYGSITKRAFKIGLSVSRKDNGERTRQRLNRGKRQERKARDFVKWRRRQAEAAGLQGSAVPSSEVHAVPKGTQGSD